MIENISIVRPANIYGRGDNFGKDSMVIPSIIKRICILLSSLAVFSATRFFSLNTETKIQQKRINFEIDFILFLSFCIPLTKGF